MTFDEWFEENRQEITNDFVAVAFGAFSIKMTAQKAWNAALVRVDEAEYAMVGSNLAHEPIPWETANSWFRYIFGSIDMVETKTQREYPLTEE